MKSNTYFLLFWFLLCQLAHHRLLAKDPDEDRKFDDLVRSHGFELQNYSVTTEDGYILTLHRVVTQDYAAHIDYSKHRAPVIVQHGLSGSASNFFINSPYLKAHDHDHLSRSTRKCGDNFGFCLVLTGRYDIWLPNSRGNSYSNGHAGGLSPDDRAYWNFTFDHMARFDLPATIRFVRNATGYSKIGYVGYSQGSNSMFALLSLSPEYAQYIQPFIAWAPPSYIGHMTSIVRYLQPFERPAQLAGGRFEFSDELVSRISELACGSPHLPCDQILEAVMGPTSHTNVTRLPVYFSYFNEATSNWNMVHFMQLHRTGKFIRYDYGLPWINMQQYGTRSPPVYPLERIPRNFTIAIMRGTTDGYISQEDGDYFVGQLKNFGLNIIDYMVPDPTWNHLDFVIGTHAGRLVYDKTVQLLDQHVDRTRLHVPVPVDQRPVHKKIWEFIKRLISNISNWRNIFG